VDATNPVPEPSHRVVLMCGRKGRRSAFCAVDMEAVVADRVADERRSPGDKFSRQSLEEANSVFYCEDDTEP